MDGKTVLITGGNSGIGKAAALELASMGAAVVIVSRDKARGEAAVSQISSQSGTGKRKADLIVADLASLASVRSLASEFNQRYDKLDVLVNNAGVILGTRSTTADGLETTFEVNYLSHFLLTNLLLDKLKKSAPSRIINVTSDAHTSGHMGFQDLQEENGYGAMKAYSQSKLAQVLFTYELSKRLAGTGVMVNCLHPGVVATNWGRHSWGVTGIFLRIFGFLMLKPSGGADTVVYLASSPDVKDVTGKYFFKRKERKSSDESYNQEEAAKLWEVSLKLSGISEK
jgi:retinol dehydrogenase 14